MPENSDLSRNVCPGSDQNASGNAHDTFIRTTASCHWKPGSRIISHIDSDDGKVPVIEFPDIWAIFECRGLLTISVRVRAESAEEVHGMIIWG